FEWDGKPQLVAGTTYMASDVQRQFFMQPNPHLWDQEMAEMRAGGLNMLRTGWWSAYDQVMKESGVVREDMLRAVEAYLLTARKNDLPVQFTFFAFIPEMFGGANPYLDPEALRRQKELIVAVVQRFRDVPYVVWDLINEPSFSNPRRLWATRPNGDPFEMRAWNEWLLQKYKTPGAIAQAWQTTPFPPGAAPLPEEWEFAPKAAMRTNQGSNALKVHDYYMFAQEKLRDWAAELKSAIRSAGGNQLVTIGQDEGGGTDRLAPVFFGDAVDFTVTHPWWLDDAVLWDTLVAKIANKPLLVQEVGQQRLPQINGYERRTPQDVSNLVERKVAIAGQTSAGAIQWLWHTNGFMKNDNEMVIGALREDGTEKPEAQMLRRFAQFAAATRGLLSSPEDREVVIVTSQALQYSALNSFALEAQQKAVRALEYYCRVAARVVTENRLAELGSPKLAILPSPQTLSDPAWALLMKYVEAGGTLLVSGSMERDPNWQVTERLKALGLEAKPEPLFYRQAQIELGRQTIPLSYDGQPQQFIEALATADGKTFHELNRGKGTILVANFP
ncbi:MAG TPA: hypothetical protein VH744_09755, partial [Terriglobales bacterium]